MKKTFLLVLAILFCFSAEADLPTTQKQFITAQNILTTNPGFENGKDGWGTSAGTFTITSTAANVAEGLFAASFAPTGTSQTLTSSQFAIPSGLFGQNCLANIKYKSAEATSPYTLQVIDGSSNVLASQVSIPTTSYLNAPISFICPSTGTIAVQIKANTSLAPASAIFVDANYAGANTAVSNVSQATFVGSAYYPEQASCDWQNSGALGDIVDNDCTTRTLAGSAVAPPTNTFGLKFATLPPGEYDLVATLDMSSGASVSCGYVLTDGTSVGGEAVINSDTSAINFSPITLTLHVSYPTAQTNVHFRVKFGVTAGSGTCNIQNSLQQSSASIIVHRFPSVPDQAVRFDQVGWKVDANIDGANPSLGNVAVSTYTGIEDGALTLTNNSVNGAIAAQIPCSGTNPSTGTTCAAGNESVGVAFNLPTAGDVRACVDFSWDGLSGTLGPTFKMVETPNNAQTVLQASTTITQAFNGSASNLSFPLSMCSVLHFTSSGLKTLRLFYVQSVAGSPSTSQLIASIPSGADIHWRVMPADQAIPAPILINSVTSSVPSQVRVDSAVVTATNGSTCTINSNPGNWLSGTTPIATGDCTVTFAVPYSATPECVISQLNPTSVTGFLLGAAIHTVSTTSVRFIANFLSSGSSTVSASTASNTLLCKGTK